MKILIDSSNMVHKAFNAVLYQISSKIMSEEKLEKKEAKEKALTQISEELVLHSVFSMFETMKDVLKNPNNNDYIFCYDNGSWRKSYIQTELTEMKILTNDIKIEHINIEYKDGRDKKGRDVIHNVLSKSEELFKQLNINCLKMENTEADDIIAMVAKSFKNEDKVIIVSNDKDFNQLMKQDNVYIYDSSSKELKKMSTEEAEKYYKMKIMIEDSSDNICSIVEEFNHQEFSNIRFGEDTAYKLVEEHGTFENIIKEISNKIYKKQEEWVKKSNASQIKFDKWFSKSVLKNDENMPISLFYKSDIEIKDDNDIEQEHKKHSFVDGKINKMLLNNKMPSIVNDNELISEFYLKLENPININTLFEESQWKNLIMKSTMYSKRLEEHKVNNPEVGEKEFLKSIMNFSDINDNILNSIKYVSETFYTGDTDSFLKNLIKITKHDGIEIINKQNENIKSYITFDNKNIKLSKDFNLTEIKTEKYTIEDITNILNHYLNRNLIMMDFNKIPENIQTKINNEIAKLTYNDPDLENERIAKILEDFKLYSLSKKYSSKSSVIEMNQ